MYFSQFCSPEIEVSVRSMALKTTIPAQAIPADQAVPRAVTDNRIQRPGDRRNLSKSAARALDVLEYFALMGRPLRAIDIAHAFDFHPSSTDQLLKTMLDSAYLVFDPQGKLYYPSPRLVKFGSWLAASYYGEDRICRLLREVHAASGEIVTLALRHGASMQIVDVLEPPSAAGTVLKGLRVPIIGSAIGSAFLAAHSETEVRRILQQISIRPERAADRIDIITNDIREVRANGYALGGINKGGGTWSLALPLPKPSAGVVMVLGLAGPSERMRAHAADLIALAQQCIEQCLH
jgi:DNA-binding IclR family transcriptional regulator